MQGRPCTLLVLLMLCLDNHWLHWVPIGWIALWQWLPLGIHDAPQFLRGILKACWEAYAMSTLSKYSLAIYYWVPQASTQRRCWESLSNETLSKYSLAIHHSEYPKQILIGLSTWSLHRWALVCTIWGVCCKPLVPSSVEFGPVAKVCGAVDELLKQGPYVKLWKLLKLIWLSYTVDDGPYAFSLRLG